MGRQIKERKMTDLSLILNIKPTTLITESPTKKKSSKHSLAGVKSNLSKLVEDLNLSEECSSTISSERKSQKSPSPSNRPQPPPVSTFFRINLKRA